MEIKLLKGSIEVVDTLERTSHLGGELEYLHSRLGGKKCEIPKCSPNGDSSWIICYLFSKYEQS